METQLARVVGRENSEANGTLSVNHRPAACDSRLLRLSQLSPERRRVEAFIADQFAKHFDASVTEFMPMLAGLYDTNGGLDAAVGYRAAAAERLFLEVYTQSPVEEMLRAQVGIDVPRAEIVEVGSLACTDGRAAMEIVRLLVPALIAEGFSWVVFTGADTVRNVFRRLNLRPLSLCIANKAMLGERQYEWGSYYDHNPIVMAGRLADGITALFPAAEAL
jgi:hypothetical protein